MLMIECMKGNGIMITGMDEVTRGIKMETFIKGNFNLEKLMVKGSICGKNHVKSMMENGLKD